MGFIYGINKLIEVYLASLKQIYKPRIWLYFLAYFILQFVVLAILANYTHPAVYPVMKPVLSLFGGEQAEIFSHYPGLYLLLPYVFQWLKLAVGILLEGLALGLTTLAFAKIFMPEKFRDVKLSLVFSRWHHLTICWAMITLFLLAINWVIPQPFEEMLHGSPKRQMIFDTLLQLLTVGVYAVFVYAIPLIILRTRNLLQAISFSFSYFLKNPFFSFFLALLSYTLTVPTSYLTGQSEFIVNRFSPELIFYIILFGLVADMIVNILLTGAVVRFLADDKNIKPPVA